MKVRSLVLSLGAGCGWLALFWLLTGVTLPVAADPGTLYVQEGGTGDCATPSDPCPSIQQALYQALPGDEVQVAGGVYSEALVITQSVTLRGGWAPGFTVQAPLSYPTVVDGGGAYVISITAGSGAVWLDGLVLRNGNDGLHINSGVVTATANTLYAMASQGIEAEPAATVGLLKNVISDTVNQGIKINGGTALLENNQVFNIRDDGIRTMKAAVRVELRGNVVLSTASDGIDVRGTTIVAGHNVVRTVAKDGIHVEDGGTVTLTGNVVENAYDTGGDGIDIQKTARAFLSGNRLYACADNGIKLDPVTGWAVLDANQVFSVGAVGIAVRQVPAFTLTNNLVATALAAGLELSGTGRGAIYHNTLAGNPAAPQGTGIVVHSPVVVALINNVVVSHAVGITATPGATPLISTTLLWGNGSDPLTGSGLITGDPLFVAPAALDYHLQPGSPAVDAGVNLGVATDLDGDPRPNGPRPDVGADERRGLRLYLPLILRNAEPPGPPRYLITADPAALAWLAEDPYRDETIPALFTYAGHQWKVDLRYRGDTTRLFDKKSWKVFFPGADLFQAQEELNLNADYPDQTLLRSVVVYDFFARAGLPAPRAGYARLQINGQPYGLFSQVEQIDERFLYRLGLNSHGNLYKPYYGGLHLEVYDDPDLRAWWYRYHYPKKTNRDSGIDDIIAFIELINNTPDAQFPTAIAQTLDVNGWIDWYAANILIGNFEMLEKDYYLYHDLSRDRWLILPWDVDLTLGHNAWGPGAGGLLDPEISWDNPIDSGTRQSQKYDGKWNALIDRMMTVPEFRFFYCRRLQELMAEEFSPAALFPRIDEFVASIYGAALADPTRWQPDGFTFADGPAELKRYATHRIQFLQAQLPTFCPALTVPLQLNELAPAGGELTDEAGEVDPWLELYNRSATLTWDLGGMYLSDDPAQPARWRIPEGTRLPPGETLLLWADGEPAEGPLHTAFRLRAAGGQLYLYDRDLFGRALLDGVTYPALAAGQACGRWPDGESWSVLAAATPGWRNVGRPPAIGAVNWQPAPPAAGQPVTITAWITDTGPLTVAVHYRVAVTELLPSTYQVLPLAPVGANLYAAQLPGQPLYARVEFYVEARDATGLVSVARPGWPQGDYRYVVGWERPPLYLSELLALNTRTLEDETGATADWLELYNAGPVDLDLGGMFLANSVGVVQQFAFTAGTIIPAGGYRLVWVDGEGANGHTNFKLSGAGEYIGLFDTAAHNYAPIDEVYFDVQTPDVAWGRYPMPGGPWRALPPTPGGPNRLTAPPAFSQVTRSPRWPGAGETVTVSAVISAGAPVTVLLWYSAGSNFLAVPLKGEGSYTGTLPPQPAGVTVRYYLEAADGDGQRALYPRTAPTGTLGYQVGSTPLPVVINEFLAANATSNTDEAGDYDDWVELYNPGATPLVLDGFYLTDHLDEPAKWAFPPGTAIPAGGYLLVWCDGDMGQGPLHTPFKLDKEGEEVALFDPHLLLLDALSFGPQTADSSYGRRPDGAELWALMSPTPGARNR